ncbi:MULTISPECIES: helix-turn-helix transcriptional regulator [unclassified Campylobacter]|uniref:helix-turn-helix transcriptional regulator n=1 Tax=unclassified Campylobacter TaxID=2593542 RepID=UPI0022E9DFAA|nr:MULTISPECIES: helix-turn-helix domain-containing protein [unclassified Campylobacter]MDA3073994.1 helix-turn-helix domain-containing protein [Campylobacter sp. JMF_10 EL2]
MRKHLVNTKELSEYLRISKSSIWRFVKSGKLPQPKRISKFILLWDLNEINALFGLCDDETTQKGGK